jgi:hypothetical protein
MTLLHHGKILLLMSEMGQKRKSSDRANVFRFTPNTGHRLRGLTRSSPFPHPHAVPLAGKIATTVVMAPYCTPQKSPH